MQAWKKITLGVFGVLGFVLITFQNCQRPMSAKNLSTPETSAASSEEDQGQRSFLKNKPVASKDCHLVVQLKNQVAAGISDLKTGSKDQVKKKRKAGSQFIQDRLQSSHQSWMVEPIFLRAPALKKVKNSKKARVHSAQETDETLENLINSYRVAGRTPAECSRIVKLLKKDPAVHSVAFDYPIKTVGLQEWIPNDPYFGSRSSWKQDYDDLWGLKAIRAGSAWPISQGKGAVVAVVDTGVDLEHPDLAANLWKNPGETGIVNGVDLATNGIDDDQNGFIDDSSGWNFVGDTNDPSDDNGHGTHVSGTIAAIGNNGIGIIGVAPMAKVMPVKVLNHTGSGEASGIAQGIKYAVDMGADVINLSLGCGERCLDNPIFVDAVSYAVQNGVLVVKAAGNSADDVALYSPENQNLEKPIVVSAHTQSSQLAGFSNYGDYVDISAPGGGDANYFEREDQGQSQNLYSNILSLLAKKNTLENEMQGAPQWIGPYVLGQADQYVRLGGTSMAAPHVSGAVALLVSRFPLFTNLQIKRLLFANARDLGDSGNDRSFGFGGLDLTAALNDASPMPVARLYMPIRSDGDKRIKITGIATAKNLMQFQIYSSPTHDNPSWSSSSITLTSGGKIDTEGLLGTFESKQAINSRSWFFKLVVKDQSGAESVAYYDYIVPGKEKPGWPLPVEGLVYSVEPTIEDFDHDGKKEILFSNHKNWADAQLLLVNSEGKYLPHFSPEDGFSLSERDSLWIDSSVKKNVGVADIDGDSRLEIVATRRKTEKINESEIDSYYIGAHYLDGKIKTFWQNPSAQEFIPNMVRLLRIDGENRFLFSKWPLLIFSRDDQFLMTEMNGQTIGSGVVPVERCHRVAFDQTPSNQVKSMYRIYQDMYRDEVLLAITDFNGQTIREFRVNFNSCDLFHLVVYDLDGDAEPEIIIQNPHESEGEIYVYNSQGKLLPGWPYRLPSWTFPRPKSEYAYLIQNLTAPMVPISDGIQVADLNQDGTPEIVIGMELKDPRSMEKPAFAASRLIALTPFAKEFFKSPIILSQKRLRAFTLADLNRDGKKEIVTASIGLANMNSYLDVFGADGSRWSWKQTLPFSPAISTPAVTDLENDGIPEILVNSTNQIHVWSLEK